ncbi:MAG: CpsD/CapB family tyrosine-protein kinase [Acidimicrobiales bacterium]
MELVEYVRILRRRWLVVAVAVLVGAVAGYLTAPGTGTDAPRFAATHTLLNDAGGVNLEQAALLVTTGDVPVEAAERLDPEIDVDVRSEAQSETSSLTVTAEADDPADAVAAANVYAEELLEALTGDGQRAYTEQLAQAEAVVEETRPVLDDLRSQLTTVAAADPQRPVVEAAFDDASGRLREANAAIDALELNGPPDGPLRTLEAATEGRVVTPEGVRAPESKSARALLLAVFGLLLGIGAAFAAERLDTRVRGRADAERAFGVPVIGEIPPLPTSRRNRDVLVAVARPAAPAVEAFRALRTVLLFAADHGPDGAAPESEKPPGRVVIVTSAAAGEGKTTTAANLAAVLAEVGKRVLVVSADLRRPRIHALFGRELKPGMVDVFSSGGMVSLDDLELNTSVPGIRLLASGAPTANPAPYLREAAALVDAARDLFDFIVVDTAPLLVANDASELTAAADAVLVIARADHTRRSAASHAIQLLQRIDAPVLGVVVVGASDTPTAYSYYRNRYYGESERPWWRRKPQRRSSEGRDARDEDLGVAWSGDDAGDDSSNADEPAPAAVTGTRNGKAGPTTATGADDAVAATRDPGA